MFPNIYFLGMDLYLWMIVIGILAAIAVFRIFSDKAGLSPKIFNFSLLTVIAAVVVGYLSAVLFQSWYSYLATGTWEWGVGATFYGGLIGGVVCFLIIYFIVGRFLFKDKLHIRQFNKMLCLIVPCIVLAHAFGRIGCLLDGCCYGFKTDSWIGIDMYVDGEWEKRLPTQLFESLFLFALFATLMYLLLKKRNEYTASIYLIAYGVWRFFIEYLRDDNRGSSGIAFLTPSQLTAILLVIAGIALALLYRYVLKKRIESLEDRS